MTVVGECEPKGNQQLRSQGERSCGSPVEDRASGFVDAQAVMID